MVANWSIEWREDEDPIDFQELMDECILALGLKDWASLARNLQNPCIYQSTKQKNPRNMNKKYWMRMSQLLIRHMQEIMIDYQSRIETLEAELANDGEICGHCPIRTISR